MLSGAKGKATVSTWAGIENSVTVAKQMQLPSAGLDLHVDIMCAVRP